VLDAYGLFKKKTTIL